jgi:hypothetical protein
MDKIDWHTLTFRPPHAAYMMFNNPSMQTVYRARYHQVRDVRIDFIRVDKAYQWMLAFSAVPACLELLEEYLRELCLCAFRKDVFFHIKSALKPECIEAALAGSIPLCCASVQNALRQDDQPLPLAEETGWRSRILMCCLPGSGYGRTTILNGKAGRRSRTGCSSSRASMPSRQREEKRARGGGGGN